MITQDTYRHKGQRQKLVNELQELGIQCPQVLSAINRMPRHYFFDPALESHAYENKAFQIGEGQTISHPYTVAFQTESLSLKKGDKVLEIGTGSGYQASILAEMGVKVFSIERNKILHHRSKQLLSELGYRRIKCFFGDGYQGLPSFAPFDKIIVTAAAPAIPSKLKEQMKTGGIMIIPVGDEKKQIMYKIIRESESNFEEIALEEFKFVPMLPGKNW